MKAGIAITFALIGALASGQAMADGNDLLQHCQYTQQMMDGNRKDLNFLEIGQCLGMIEGVRNTMLILNTALPLETRVCFPESGINNGQAVRIVTKYLQDYPAQLNKNDTLLTMMAYRQAYPCKK